MLFYARTPADLRGVEGTFAGAENFFLGALSSVLRTGGTFFDVGSSFPGLSVPMAKLLRERGQVIAFDPESDAFRRLRAHVKLNGLSNVRTYQKALGEENAKGKLVVQGDSCPSLISRGAARQNANFEWTVAEPDASLAAASSLPGAEAQAVDIVQGDWFRETKQVPVPRALKVAAEGYGYCVLRGLQRTLAHPACALLCCEIHPNFLAANTTGEAITGIVGSAGFAHIVTRLRGAQIHMTACKQADGQASC